MPTTQGKEEKHHDLPILFFFGVVTSVGLIIALNYGKGGGVTATLNGSLVSDGGTPTKVSFLYKQDNQAWTESPRVAATAGTQFHLVVPKLVKGATYYFMARAENVAGIVVGQSLTFVP